MHIIVIIQRVEKISHVFAVRVIDLRKILREITYLRRDNLPAGGLQGFRNCVEFSDLRGKARAFLPGRNILTVEWLDFLRTSFDGVGVRVAIRIRVCRFDYAHVIEEEPHAAGLTKRTSLKYFANLRRSTVAVIRQALDDHRHLVRRKTFVGHQFVFDFLITDASALLDRTLDRVAIHGRLLRFFDGSREPRVEIRISPAELRRDHDFAGELCDHLPLLLRAGFASCLFPLCAHGRNKHQTLNKFQTPKSWFQIPIDAAAQSSFHPRMKSTLSSLAVAILALACDTTAIGAELPVISLWPGTAPGETNVIGEERDTTKTNENLVAGQRVIRLGNVSKPTITLHRAPQDKDTGATVVVFPGGGYNILALDLEGTEVCDWLNSIGVNAVLLKYRVPKRAGLEKHAAALQDAQRAVGLVRARAKEFGIDPQRIGVLGFSAGGHLAAALSASANQRIYPAVDDADKASCRPDFSILIYPAYLTLKDQNDRINPETAVSSNTPPAFITITQDDPVRVEGALFYSVALKQAGVPFELHVYPKGGHGYGLRRTENPVTAWPDRAADWMRSRGLLKR